MARTAFRIEAFQARHFKPFIDTTWLEIKPITLFFGHNSSGKSAILSILPMLRQTIEDPNPETPFVFTSERGVDLGLYEEVAHQHRVSLETPIWFNLRIGTAIEETRDGYSHFLAQRLTAAARRLDINADAIRIEIAASYNKKRRRIAITDYALFDDDGNQILRTYRKTTAANQRWHTETTLAESEDLRIAWDHFNLHFGGPYSSPRDKSRALIDLSRGISGALGRDLNRLVHIGPLRDFPHRAYRFSGESPADVGQRGENWLSILLQARDRGRLADQVNEWLVKLGYTLRIDWGRQGYVHPLLKDETGLETSLKDIGFGVSQVLPVLVQGFSCEPGTILILEQPEIHLHPRAQAVLGDVLLAIARRGIRLLVETHSEHLLLRLRRRLAEGFLRQADRFALHREDMHVYFIERCKDHSEVYRVRLSDFGEFLDPPERFQTFFSNDYEETMEWTQAVARIAQEADRARGH